jgi:hypothetical protein
MEYRRYVTGSFEPVHWLKPKKSQIPPEYDIVPFK